MPGQFDLIVISDVLGAFGGPHDICRARDKLVTALTPGGYLLYGDYIGNRVTQSIHDSGRTSDLNRNRVSPATGTGCLQMEQLLEKARAYLDALEADRQAALTLSEQKAEEAKLIQARQQGFQAAVELLGREIAAGAAEADPARKELVRRRGRRRIREMILRELSFSGEAMTTTQIAGAIDYIPQRTEAALERMEKGGWVLRNEGRWTSGSTSFT
jgi:hypothetical protein